jgi:hypothetical protein
MKTIFALLFLTGCGALDRFSAHITGDASEVCHDGVLYLQFTSGASVKYNTDGTMATCK